MPPLLGSKTQSQAAKVVPNGGLGGLVPFRHEAREPIYVAADSKSVRKFHCRPPPLQISSGCEVPTASPAQFSATSSLGLGDLWIPQTPIERRKHSLLVGDHGAEASPTTSRYTSATPYNTMSSPPATPISPNPVTLAELPGSLLLASQGFPQSLPISPPPSLRLLRRESEESTISTVPSLSASASPEEGNMEAFRNLTTRKHDRSRADMPTSYTIGGRTPAITQPFAVMTVEELLDALPGCDSRVISQYWIPAMRLQIHKMINVLKEAGGLQIDKGVDQVTLNDVLKSFCNQVRLITDEYRRVVEAAEGLAERDTTANDEHLRGLEDRIEEAVGLLEAKDKEIEDRDQRLSTTRSTLHEIVRLLGTFIQANIPSWVDTVTDPRTQQVLHVVADYTRDADPDSAEYVRIPEHTLNKHLSEIRDSRSLVDNYRKILQGQSAVINDQSRNLDAYVKKYESVVKQVQEKDHEIILLVQQNDDLTKQLQENKTVRVDNHNAAAEAEAMGRRYDELRGNMESLKTAHELELDQKDAEIANLRRKLGSAREEVFARREDVKNVVAQTQAMLQAQPDPHTAAPKSSNTSKALRFFGMEREKYKKASIPGSHSTLGLSSVDFRYSSKEVAPAPSKETLRHRPSLQEAVNLRPTHSTPNTPVTTSLDSSGFATRPFSDLHRPPPPRSDSFGARQHYGSNPTSPITPVDRFKPLPDHPMTLSQLATARLADATTRTESPLQAQIASDYISHGIMGQTSQTARRVLSRITEVSTPPKSGTSREEGSLAKLDRVHEDDISDHSVASSDREVYRKSISALDMLNSSSDLAYTETETDFDGILRSGGALGEAGSPQTRSISRRAATALYTNTRRTLDGEHDNSYTSTARVQHLRHGPRDLRRAGGTHDAIVEEDPHGHRRQYGVIGEGRVDHHPIHPRDRESSNESTQDRRERIRNPARESLASNGSSAGYRTEDSEPKTVAQLYHMGGKHIRG